jgi:hypothetical protein
MTDAKTGPNDVRIVSFDNISKQDERQEPAKSQQRASTKPLPFSSLSLSKEPCRYIYVRTVVRIHIRAATLAPMAAAPATPPCNALLADFSIISWKVA